jgi:hypothetical protein
MYVLPIFECTFRVSQKAVFEGGTVVRKLSFGEKIPYLPRGWIFLQEIWSRGLILHVDWFDSFKKIL